MLNIRDRIASAIERYQKEHWITLRGTHVLIDEDGEILKGPPALKGIQLGKPVPKRKADESEKQWLKRIAPDLPAPRRLPENHSDYFNMDRADATVSIGRLKSTKTDAENEKGGGNAPKFMDLSRRGLTGKRDPITVRPNDSGGYDVVDGNGTFTGAKHYGWKTLPVQIEKKLPEENRKPFFTDEEMSLPKERLQPVAQDAGYDVLAAKAKVADHQLRTLLDFGKGLGAQLGYETILPGVMKLDEIVERCKKPGGIVWIGGLKPEASAKRKVRDDYNGHWNRLLDIARATVVVDAIDDVHKVIDKARAMGAKLARRPKDHITNPIPDTHYRDINMNLEMPNGMIVEMQINLKPMIIAKKTGHLDYEIIREISGKLHAEGDREPTASEKSRLQQALNANVKLYDAAWEKCLGSKEKYSRRCELAESRFRKMF